jgi:hypothetical protein
MATANSCIFIQYFGRGKRGLIGAPGRPSTDGRSLVGVLGPARVDHRTPSHFSTLARRRHLDVRAQHRADAMCLGKLDQPFDARSIRTPVFHHHPPRIDRIAGQQPACLRVAEGDALLLVPRHRNDVRDALPGPRRSIKLRTVSNSGNLLGSVSLAQSLAPWAQTHCANRSDAETTVGKMQSVQAASRCLMPLVLRHIGFGTR